jgi:hypothetical protein
LLLSYDSTIGSANPTTELDSRLQQSATVETRFAARAPSFTPIVNNLWAPRRRGPIFPAFDDAAPPFKSAATSLRNHESDKFAMLFF